MASSPKLPVPFEPVPVRYRHDGWTAERQIAFVEKLADSNSITAACKHVGMSRESVRKLRRRPCGRAFRDACDAALDCGYAEIEETAMERVKNGVPRPVFYQGEQVEEWRHYDERLPRPPSDIPGIDPDEQIPFDPEGELEGCLFGLQFAPDPPPEDDESAWPAAQRDEQ